VAGTRCDEVIASWKGSRGFLRSPPNTLVYKKGGNSPSDDVKCLYRFVTDKRLYARVILNINAINFKVRSKINFIKMSEIESILISIFYRNTRTLPCRVRTVTKIEPIS
jgi:hypothetical protein